MLPAAQQGSKVFLSSHYMHTHKCNLRGSNHELRTTAAVAGWCIHKERCTVIRLAEGLHIEDERKSERTIRRKPTAIDPKSAVQCMSEFVQWCGGFILIVSPH